MEPVTEPSSVAATPSAQKSRKPVVRLEARAGLLLPVARIRRELRAYAGVTRMSADAVVAFAAGIETILSDVLEGAAEMQASKGRLTLKSIDVSRTISDDAALAAVFPGVIIANGGVVKTNYFRQKAHRDRYTKKSAKIGVKAS